MTNRNKSENIKNMTRIAFFTAILSVLSQISFPSPSGMPFTLQTFGICLCGYYLGARKAFIAAVTYLLAGLCGIPVFAGFSGGIGHFLGGSGGFLVGFCVLALLCGAGSKKTPVAAFCCGISGLVICHAIGVLWFGAVTNTELSGSFFAASAVYIPKDVISLAGAYYFALFLKKHVR